MHKYKHLKAKFNCMAGDGHILLGMMHACNSQEFRGYAAETLLAVQWKCTTYLSALADGTYAKELRGEVTLAYKPDGWLTIDHPAKGPMRIEHLYEAKAFEDFGKIMTSLACDEDDVQPDAEGELA